MDLFYILLFIFFICLFGGGLLFLASLLGPKVESSDKKLSFYECGIGDTQTENTQLPVKFYLTAILFILFDIEIIFLYPWAIGFNDFVEKGHGVYILSVMGFFLLIFILGLLWEVFSKALDWE